MTDFYLKSGAGAVERANSAVKSVGDRMVLARADTSTNYTVVRKWVWECTTAGTTGAAVPAWPASVTQDVTTVTDGTVVWTARRPGYSSGTTANWSYAAIYSDYVDEALAAGDRLFVSSAHADAISALVSIKLIGQDSAPNQVFCVSDAAAPPTALATGAVIAPTGTFTLQLNDAGKFVYWYGMSFKSGSTGGSISLLEEFVGENCNFELRGAAASTNIYIGNGARLVNPIIKFSAASQYLNLNSQLYIQGGSLDGVGVTPTYLIKPYSERVLATFTDFDMSAMGAAMILVDAAATAYAGDIKFIRCRLPNGWTGRPLENEFASAREFRVSLYDCDYGDSQFRVFIDTNQGAIQSDVELVPTGVEGIKRNGADVPFSLRFENCPAGLFPMIRLRGDPIVLINETVGSALTVSLEIIHNVSSPLTDKQVGLEVSYSGNIGSPLGVFARTEANPFASATNWAASTKAWDSKLTARANSTAYVLDNKRKVASNSGRAFICTTAGTSASSEPGAYATAVDGDSITDGTAVFKAMRRQKVSLSITPQEQGPITVIPWCSIASTNVWLSSEVE